MAKWELLAEHKDTGYYIGWHRIHRMIHTPKPMQPMSKDSLVQIGGHEGLYEVRGMTTAHSILPDMEYSIGKLGLKLFDETHICKTLLIGEKSITWAIIT